MSTYKTIKQVNSYSCMRSSLGIDIYIGVHEITRELNHHYKEDNALCGSARLYVFVIINLHFAYQDSLQNK